MLWYRSVTGVEIATGRPHRRPPRFWHEALSSYVGFGVRLARGPHRRAIADHAGRRITAPSVGAMHEWRDPVPGVCFAFAHLRHPRALVRPFLVDIEVADTDAIGHPVAPPTAGDDQPGITGT